MTKDDHGPVIQYAHGGRWHTMTGHGERPEDYEAKVAKWNLRDGWPRWRVADASTDRETGAPSEPVVEPTPWKDEDVRDLLRLSSDSMDRTLEQHERDRLNEITLAHRFERISGREKELIREIRDGRKPR